MLFLERIWFTRIIPNEKYPGRSLMENKKQIEWVNGEIVVDGIFHYSEIGFKYYPGRDPYYHLFTVFNNYIELYDFLLKYNTPNREFHEVIIGKNPQKLRFDIDLDLSLPNISYINPTLLISQIIEVLCTKWNWLDVTKDIIICNSSNDNKGSYHIIVDNYYVTNFEEGSKWYKEICTEVAEKYPSEILRKLLLERVLDPQIYANNHPFRMLFSFRKGERQKRIVTEWKYHDYDIIYKNTINSISERHNILNIFSASLCTFCLNSKMITPRLINQSGYKISKNGELVPRILKPEETKTALKLYDKKIGKIARSFRIGDWDESNKLILYREQASFCKICQRVHDNQNSYIYITNNGDIYFNCFQNRSNDKSIKLGNIDDEKPEECTFLNREGKIEKIIVDNTGNVIMLKDSILLKYQEDEEEPVGENMFTMDKILEMIGGNKDINFVKDNIEEIQQIKEKNEIEIKFDERSKYTPKGLPEGAPIPVPYPPLNNNPPSANSAYDMLELRRKGIE